MTSRYIGDNFGIYGTDAISVGATFDNAADLGIDGKGGVWVHVGRDRFALCGFIPRYFFQPEIHDGMAGSFAYLLWESRWLWDARCIAEFGQTNPVVVLGKALAEVIPGEPWLQEPATMGVWARFFRDEPPPWLSRNWERKTAPGDPRLDRCACPKPKR